MSRHRGAKPPRRYELLGEISLLSPGQLLSVNRRHFHPHTAGSLTPTFVTVRPVSLTVRLVYAFALYNTVSDRSEPTFERLRYPFGGDRPSQTAYLTLSSNQIHGRKLELQHLKGGIPRATPHKLTPMLQSLPPILYKRYQNPILSYSEAPWGLFVQSRVTGIFTGTTISPGGLLRQCPDRYTIRAGQNLPDKEFRYLRTVIVTAAVHRGFNSKLSPLLLTFRHWAGVSPYTSSYDLAETCVFDKQSPGPIICNSISEHPFSLSYGVNLPSSLTTLLPLALESSSHLPVSVCGTGS